MRRRRAWAAGMLSIIPGAGQLYCGEPQRGIALLFGLPAQTLVLWGIFGVAPHRLIYWSIGGKLAAAALGLVWLWNIADALRLARGGRTSAALPIFLIVTLNLAAGWHVTRMDLFSLASGVPQMRNIAGSLVRPALVERRYEVVSARQKFYVPGPGAPQPERPPRPSARGPSITLSPLVSRKGDRITVIGRGFPPEQTGRIYIYIGAERPGPRFTTDRRGRFETVFTNEAPVPGDFFVEARVSRPLAGWQTTKTLRLTSSRMLETIFMALMGTAFSIVVTFPLSFLGARNLMKGSRGGRVVYSLTRSLFNVLRSIEVLIIAVMLAAAVGIGPFAGVLALAIHGIGALGKLYSEAIESIDPGPREAITATGASRLQVIAFGVVPQVVPQFIAFTIYRWDINVRMATIIGLVGGGGIGDVLLQYIGLLQWREAATAIWLIAAVVMLMDYASAVIRERMA